MSKNFASIILSFIFFIFSFSSVFAQAPIRYYDWSSTLEKNRITVLGAATPSADLYRFNKYLFGADLTPETPFYLLKRFQENVSLMTTFNNVEKEKLKLSIAAERLNEAEKLAQKGSGFGMGFVSDNYRQTMNDLSQNLEKLQKQNVNVADLLKLVDLETAKHTVVLERVLVLAPKSAKQAMERAREGSWEGADMVADLTGRPAVPPDMASRIAALRSQGLLTEEEANKLIGAKTRNEAREEFKKYVQEGIVPESDFLRLNENLKTYFPAEFYQIHETKRFYALKKWEEQKPDEATLNKVQEFAKTYVSGEAVPADLRRYWGSLVQLEELQSTIRPDLIDANLFKNNPEDDKKFKEIVERYKPRPEDVAFLNNYLTNNSGMADNLPPEYQRMKSLAEKFGAQCGPGMKWIQKIIGSRETGVATGMCIPENSINDERPIEVENKNCLQVITSAKSPDGFCIVFPNSCLPQGWSKVESCTETMPKTETTAARAISCPSNSHFVPVYGSNNGYCVPNYTPVSESVRGNAEMSCPAGYHRNYQGGSCLPDFSEKFASERGYLPPVMINPGGYPQPFYPPVQRCQNNQYWVPEPINPQGGYCMSNSYQPPNVPNPQMGNCRTPGECYDWCKANPQSDKCPGFNPNQPRPKDSFSPSPESQEAACRAGGGVCVSWNNGACGCERPGSVSNCRPPDQGCGTTKWWDYRSCSCKDNGSYPSACAYPSGGCSSGNYWDSSACQCRSNPSGSTGGMGSRESQEAACRAGGGTCTSWVNEACSCQGYQSPSTPYTPPSGYGSCSSGQYWNGSACVNSSPTDTPTTESMQQACQSGGCSWTGSACNCPSQNYQTPAPTSAPSTSQPQPTSAPQEQTPPPATAPSSPTP